MTFCNVLLESCMASMSGDDVSGCCTIGIVITHHPSPATHHPSPTQAMRQLGVPYASPPPQVTCDV